MPIRKTVKARWPDADEIKPTLELNAKTSIKLEFLFGESAELSHIKRTCQLHFFCDIYFKAALNPSPSPKPCMKNKPQIKVG